MCKIRFESAIKVVILPQFLNIIIWRFQVELLSLQITKTKSAYFQWNHVKLYQTCEVTLTNLLKSSSVYSILQRVTASVRLNHNKQTNTTYFKIFLCPLRTYIFYLFLANALQKKGSQFVLIHYYRHIYQSNETRFYFLTIYFINTGWEKQLINVEWKICPFFTSAYLSHTHELVLNLYFCNSVGERIDALKLLIFTNVFFCFFFFFFTFCRHYKVCKLMLKAPPCFVISQKQNI